MKKEYLQDFELWAAECVKIVDKQSGLRVPFILNNPQRRVLALLEEQRRSGRPIRAIILKARQWGCSTLIEVYMSWFQLVHHYGWNSLVCAHLKDVAAGIKGTYSRLLADYPDALKEGDKRKWIFAPYEKSQSVSEIPARDCTVTIASSLSPNSARGTNLKMAHLSEVAFWDDGNEKRAEDIVRTVSGSITRDSDTLVVMESTANGSDNFFFREWNRAVAGESDKTPIFVAWHEIELYRLRSDQFDREKLIAAADDYEKGLLAGGVDIEAVAWYHEKRKEYSTHESMMAEFPSTPEEAFCSSSSKPLIPKESLPSLQRIDIEDYTPKYAVAMLGDNINILSVYGEKESRLAPVKDYESALSMKQFVAEVVKIAVKEQIPVMISESVNSEKRSHARFISENLTRKGVTLISDEEENYSIAITPDNVAYFADIYEDLCLDGKIIELNEKAIEQLAALTTNNLKHSPLALSRLLATSMIGRYSEKPLYNFDFF